jgi:hypothetical protein
MESIDDKGAAGFAPAAIMPRISLDDLNKIDIRVGTIEFAEWKSPCWKTWR